MNRLNKLSNSIERLVKEMKLIQDQIDDMESQYKIIMKEKMKEIVVEDKRGTLIMTRPDGIAIAVGKPNARHYERKVWWQVNGKRGELIDDSSRAYPDVWKRWLVNVDILDVKEA